MAEWDSALYLRFEKERTQPALDLAARVAHLSPARVADIGCGPGNSTAVLRLVFPDTEITGLDSSVNMIERARCDHPELLFRLCDVHELEAGYDLLFSNACLQWVPDHERLLPELMGKLADGGTLAVQIPMNDDEPVHEIIREAAAQKRWGFAGEPGRGRLPLSPEDYYNILAGCASAFCVWETVYYHSMPSAQAIVDWVKGTALRPFLALLDKANGEAFEREITDRVEAAYPVMKNGERILRFRRFFFVANKQQPI